MIRAKEACKNLEMIASTIRGCNINQVVQTQIAEVANSRTVLQPLSNRIRGSQLFWPISILRSVLVTIAGLNAFTVQSGMKRASA